MAAALVLGMHAARASDAASDRAQADLGHLTLVDAERLMVERNRDARTARRALDSARADILIAGATQIPTAAIGVSNVNPQVGIGPGGLRDKAFDTQFRVDYTIERGDKRELRVATAESAERASRADLEDTLRVQRTVLASAYYDLLQAQQRTAISRETAELFQSTLRASELRLRAGDVSVTDVNRIRVDALRAATDERAAMGDLRRAQLALSALLRVETDAMAIVAVDLWPAGSTPEPVRDAEEWVVARADVTAAKARVEAAFSARALARSQRVRDVGFGVTYDHWPTNGANMQGTGNSFGVQVSIPLFLGNHYDGEIARAEVELASAEDQLERVTAAAQADLQRTESDLAIARERLAKLDTELLPAARVVAEAQEFAYRKGAIGVLDLLDARRTLRAVLLDESAAHADFAKALFAWRQARAGATEKLH